MTDHINALSLCARAGSPVAEEALFQRLRPLASRWLRARASYSADRLQEVMLLTLGAVRDEWDPGKAPLVPFLMRYAWRRVFRERKRVEEVPLGEGPDLPRQPASRRYEALYELRDRVLALARNLDLRAAVLVSGIAAGAPVPELAHRLGVSVATAYRDVESALDALAARVKLEKPHLNITPLLMRALLRDVSTEARSERRAA